MKRDRAETIALLALAHVAGDETLLHEFMRESGMDATALRQAAGDPTVLGGVLDFILGDDSRVTAFAAAADLKPEEPMRARFELPGGTAGDRGAL
jgi:hypothetical protein